MKIAIGCDHGGLELKLFLQTKLAEEGYEILDCGLDEWKEVDYPDISEAVSRSVVDQKADCGIIICGTGIGVSIAANKINGIRAALVSDTYSAKMAKAHNYANVITLGNRVMGIELGLEIVNAYLQTDFLGDKHAVRVDKIMKLETEES